jgi:hypothetical protein
MAIYLGNKLVSAAALGNLPVSNIANVFETTTVIPTDDLIFWLDGTSFTTGSPTWNSNYGLPYSGSFTGATPVQKRTDNGGVVNFTTSSAMRFGGPDSLDYRAEDFTLVIANRYSGSASDVHGRMLCGVSNNWLAPTYGGTPAAGTNEKPSAYYNGSTFIIDSGSYDTEWRISTVVRDKTNLSSSFYLNSVLVASGSNNETTNGFFGLSINDGVFSNGTTNPGQDEVNQADVGDVILYNRVLNQSEITQIHNTLKDRYGI